MRQSSIVLLTVLLVEAYSAPQLITFSEGKLGVNFGGYHAGVGLGGQGGSGRAGGGLYAEAGTPFGPAAKAGLAGGVDGEQGSAGGLYAGATAGGNVNAAAGLGGGVGGGKAVGGGFSTAQAGSHSSSSVLGGDSNISGTSGFSISAHKSIGVPTTVVKETEVSVVPIDEIKTVHKKVHGKVNFEANNEIAPVANAGIEAHVDAGISANAQPAIYETKEVNIAPPLTQVIVHKHKPHSHVHKEVYVGGYLGGNTDFAGPVSTVVVKTHPIDKKIDVDTEGGVYSSKPGATINGQYVGPGKVTTFSSSHGVVISNNAQTKPNTFFQDIFNIPISTLKAVSGFLSNTAGSTNVSIQKSASINTETDLITPKHVPSSSSSSSSSQAHVSVQTPGASKFIDDIFSIPINTLSAVNTFLENNVAARKRIQVTAEGTGEPTRIRLGPHARRRANKRVVIVKEEPSNQSTPQESN